MLHIVLCIICLRVLFSGVGCFTYIQYGETRECERDCCLSCIIGPQMAFLKEIIVTVIFAVYLHLSIVSYNVTVSYHVTVVNCIVLVTNSIL